MLIPVKIHMLTVIDSSITCMYTILCTILLPLHVFLCMYITVTCVFMYAVTFLKFKHPAYTEQAKSCSVGVC